MAHQNSARIARWGLVKMAGQVLPEVRTAKNNRHTRTAQFANHEDMQVQQLAAMAVAARPDMAQAAGPDAAKRPWLGRCSGRGGLAKPNPGEGAGTRPRNVMPPHQRTCVPRRR